MRDFDVTTPHSARVLDYFLGGKDNFAADRAAGDRALAEPVAITLMSVMHFIVLGRRSPHALVRQVPAAPGSGQWGDGADQ